MNSDRGDQEYVVPRYRAGDGEAWFHFLHGNVPGHEIDFMYRPEVPQGALAPQHYSHLARLMRYIEPHDGAAYAFTVGNLSRDDTQYEPGHGGVALIFGLRIRGATDHAGRPDPPFAHGIAAIDRALDAPTLRRAAIAFHGRVLGGAASAEWYRSYVRASSEARAELERVLAGYVASFDDLPRPAPSAMSLAWTTRGAAPPGRVAFVYPDDTPFEALASAAARIAAVLYRSDVRWSAISNGREADLANGTTVRFLPESAVGRGEAAARALEEIPEEEEAIARELFGAVPVRAGAVASRWPERYEATGGEVAVEDVTLIAPPRSEQEIQVTLEAPVSAPATSASSSEMEAGSDVAPTATKVEVTGSASPDEARATGAASTGGAPLAPLPAVVAPAPNEGPAGCAPVERPPARRSPPESSRRGWRVVTVAAMCSVIAAVSVTVYVFLRPLAPPIPQLDDAPAAITQPSPSQFGTATAAPPLAPPAPFSAPSTLAQKPPPAPPAPRTPWPHRSPFIPVDAGSIVPADPTLIYHSIP